MWGVLKEDRVDQSTIRWTQEQDQGDVQDLLLQWNSLHFFQTNNAPMNSEIRRQQLALSYLENEIDQILDGDFLVKSEEKINKKP